MDTELGRTFLAIVKNFRKRLVEPHLKSGKLHLVPGAPSFFYPVYAVSSLQGDDEPLQTALQGMREIVAAKASA